MSKTKKQKTSAETKGAEAETPAAPARTPRADLVMVPIDSIETTDNARSAMDAGLLCQLADSINEIGLMEPVICRKAGKKIEMIAGHRRLMAARSAGETFIEAKVYGDLDDRTAARMQLTENLQREDLNHVDVARQLDKASKAGMKNQQIAAEINVSDDYVRDHITLLRLDEPVLELVAGGRLPFKHAGLIARVGDPAKQRSLAGECVNREWHAKAATWNPGRNHYGQEKTDPPDYVMPMEELRKRVGYAMCSLAACGWQKVEADRKGGFAGKRPCRGCPDNTTSYLDQPMLFAGIRPQGSDKKGHCTNRPCYETKKKAWDKVLEGRRKEREKLQAEQIRKAKRAGLDICADCFRVADAGESYKVEGGRKCCPKCVAKAKERGGTVPAGPPKPEPKPFPDTDAERLALALWQWGLEAVDAIAKKLTATPDDKIDWRLLIGFAFATEEVCVGSDVAWSQRHKPVAAAIEEARAGRYPQLGGEQAALLAGDLLDNLHEGQWDHPSAQYRKLSDDTRTAIDLAEALAVRLGVEIRPRPKAEDIAKADKPKADKPKAAKPKAAKAKKS